MHVRRVAREEHAPDAQPRDHSAVQMKIRRPREIADLQIRRHARAHDFAAQLERRLALVVERAVARRAIGDEPVAAAAHREEPGEALARREQMDLVVGPVGAELEIGEHERLLERMPDEIDVEQMPDRAARAVRRDDVRRLQTLVAAVAVAQPHVERAFRLRAMRERHAALDVHVERREMLGQQTLGDGLVEKQQVRIARLQRIEVELGDALAGRVQDREPRAMAELDEPVDDALLLEELERSGLNADRARVARGSGRLVDDTHRHAGARETKRGGEPRRTGADDQHGRRGERNDCHKDLVDTQHSQSTPAAAPHP